MFSSGLIKAAAAADDDDDDEGTFFTQLPTFPIPYFSPIYTYPGQSISIFYYLLPWFSITLTLPFSFSFNPYDQLFTPEIPHSLLRPHDPTAQFPLFHLNLLLLSFLMILTSNTASFSTPFFSSLFPPFPLSYIFNTFLISFKNTFISVKHSTSMNLVVFVSRNLKIIMQLIKNISWICFDKTYFILFYFGLWFCLFSAYCLKNYIYIRGAM